MSMDFEKLAEQAMKMQEELQRLQEEAAKQVESDGIEPAVHPLRVLRQLSSERTDVRAHRHHLRKRR